MGLSYQLLTKKADGSTLCLPVDHTVGGPPHFLLEVFLGFLPSQDDSCSPGCLTSVNMVLILFAAEW